jgi:hypothetical protein
MSKGGMSDASTAPPEEPPEDPPAEEETPGGVAVTVVGAIEVVVLVMKVLGRLVL